MAETRMEKIEKAMTDLDDIAKSDVLDHRTRERVRKSQRELQLAYLKETNPTAAAAWRAANGRLLD